MRRAKEEGIVLERDLVGLPHVRPQAADRFEVVFDGRPDSLLWKDWLVSVARGLAENVEGVAFEGFYDLLTGARHPASGSLGQS